MDRRIDRPQNPAAPTKPAAEASARPALRGIALTGVLLMGAVLASVLAVDIPTPVGQGDAATQSYVPASDRWIPLGPPETAEPQDGSATVDAALAKARQQASRLGSG